jgi:hypothetical protein
MSHEQLFLDATYRRTGLSLKSEKHGHEKYTTTTMCTAKFQAVDFQESFMYSCGG